MKILKQILIFGLLVSIINCTCQSSEDSDGDSFSYVDITASKKTCSKRQFSTKEQNKKAYKCCYRDSVCTFLGIKTTHKGCEPLTEADYKDIKTYVQIAKGSGICEKYDIECSGNVLNGLLYSIFILLFIF